MTSSNISKLLDEALYLAKQGKAEEEIECYDKILQEEPNNLQAILGKGIALVWLKEIEEAQPWLDKALEILREDSVFENLLTKYHRDPKDTQVAAVEQGNGGAIEVTR